LKRSLDHGIGPLPISENAMPFRPDAFAGRPLAELLSAVARLDRGALADNAVQLHHHARMVAPTVTGNTLLADDHPVVDVPGVMLEQYLGGGGQGCVFAGRVMATGALIAVKLLSHGRAVREALLAARVRHPNVLRVLRAQRAGHYWVLLMELVHGDELGAVAPASPRVCFAKLADALTAVAAARLVHRDVKPANVLLRQPDATPVLVDFGLAVDLGSTQPEDDAEVSGTPFFLPPEAWRDARPEPSWDAYALGVTAAVVLGAAPKFPGDLATIRPAKLNGTFDLALRDSLTDVEDITLRDWAGALVAPEPHCRWTALASAARWLAV
jgi:serine/threonine protein kinase